MGTKRDPQERFFSHVNFFGPTQAHMSDCCWIWTGAHRQGHYGAFNLDPSQRPNKIVQTHRWIYEETYGKIRGNYDCGHKCDVKLCVRPTHLEKIRHRQNMQDASARGLMPCGEHHYLAKLSDEKVAQMRQFHTRLDVGAAELARLYRVTEPTIHRILDGSGWKHVTATEAA